MCIRDSNGDAYTYNPNDQNQQRSTHNANQQLCSPNSHQNQQHFSEVNDDPMLGGRQPLYANAPPKPKRLNSSSGFDDETLSPERRVAGTQQEVDNTDDDGGFEEHRGYRSGSDDRSRRPNPTMATAIYRHPLGANQAKVVDDAGIVVGNPIQSSRFQPPVHHQQQYRHRYVFHSISISKSTTIITLKDIS